MTDRSQPPATPRKRFFVILLLAIAGLLGWGGWRHWQTASEAAETQRQTQDFVPTVRTAVAQRQDQPVALTLPGQILAFDVANIYARATGYVAERHVDIGSRVEQGAPLLRIASPDTDAQLLQAEAQVGQNQAAVQQAEANLNQAAANSKLAQVTNTRESTLAQQGWETKQNADNAAANKTGTTAAVASAQAAIDVAKANLQAQLATVQRLQALTRFENVTAPFSGVVTARNVDVGDLVTADNASAAPMFTLQRDDMVRMSVAVPQSAAVSIRNGLDAEVRIPELPQRVFHGKVARSSVALDPSSRTLAAQVDVANPDHVLHPGLYVQITFHIPREQPGVVVPDEALVFNSSGMQVAVVGDDNTVHMRTIAIYRDFGTSAELRDGLSGGEKLVLNLPADVGDGGKVRLQDDQQGKPDGQQTSQLDR